MDIQLDSLTQAIFDRLSGDEVLGGWLAPSVITDEGPAIYSTIPVPPGAKLPYVVADGGNVTAEPDDPAPVAQYRDVIRDIHCYDGRPDDGGGSVIRVNAIAERVRALFHQLSLALPMEGSYAKNLRLLASGPVVNDGPTAFGRVVSLHMRIAVAAAVEA